MSKRGSIGPFRITAYYGNRWFLMLAPTYLLDRAENPYRRLSATVLLARRRPFQLEVGNQPLMEAYAAVIAPNALRRRTLALDSDLALFDIPVGSPEHSALAPVLRPEGALCLDVGRFTALVPVLEQAAAGLLTCAEVHTLFSSVVEAISGRAPLARELDQRIRKALTLIDQLKFDQVGLDVLAAEVHVSTSRLRHLFTEQTGCSLTQYARWVAVWRAVNLWKTGKALTDIAHEVGFYDLAHLDRAFNEVFGLNPSTFIDPELMSLIRCCEERPR